VPSRKELSKPLSGVLAAAAVIAVVGLLQATGLLNRWELGSRDLRARWTLPPARKSGQPPFHPDLVMINVTDESLKKMDEELKGMKWPWDREVQAHVVKACARGKATCLLYDFLINEVQNPDDEAYLVDAVKAGPATYFAGAFREIRLDNSEDTPEHQARLAKQAIDVDNDGSVRVPEKYKQVILPTPRLCEAAAGVCDISTPRDEDALIRRYRLFSIYKGRAYPSFVLAALMAKERVGRVVVRSGTLTVGSLTFPIEKDGTILLRYYPPVDRNVLDSVSPFEVRSAFNVINDAFREIQGKPSQYDYREFERRFVFFGTSAAGLTDLRDSPVSAQPLPGVEIHMTALANILKGEFLREVPRWVSTLFFMIMAVLVAVVTRCTPALVGGMIASGAALASTGASVFLYKERWVVDLIPALLSAVFAYAAASALNFITEGRQRLRVKREFQRYMSPKVVEKILKNPDALLMAAERKPLTIFFLDFAGFTAMSEKLDPTELFKLVSEYHHEAAEEIFKTEGTLDKYIGDAIMAFWNDPIELPDHSLRACLSAIGAQKRLREMALQMKERGLPEMRARIGINTGTATVGNMGAKGQVNYTVMGDEVNLASRLEGVNKEFGTDIIASEATYLPAKERVEARELALIKVKGKKVPVRIFEVLGLKGEVPPDRLETARKFEQGLQAFRARDFPKAREIFQTLLESKDRAAEPYLALCDRYLRQPPPADWDGSYQMETK
jgi:adenylate cyclase